MIRKVLGTGFALLFLGIIVMIARENLSLDDWTASNSDGEESLANSEADT